VKFIPCFLENTVQNYHWGQSGKNALIPDLLNQEPEPGKVYAELWIGAHPKAPSKILTEDGAISFNDWIDLDPAAILGNSAAEKFGNRLPFLLKVLTVARPLSIQTHPNKAQAGKLYLTDPENYPDANHKPEQTIALGKFTAFIGFKSHNKIKMTIDKYPELRKVFNINEIYDEALLKPMLKNIFKFSSNDPFAFSRYAQNLAEKISLLSEKTSEESTYLRLFESQLSTDPGLFLIFLLNLVQLEQNEGVFIPTGVPHVYMQGNIIECMANSDNVVRGGLTPKFIDSNTLIDILNYHPEEVDISLGNRIQNTVYYPVRTEEFAIRKHTFDACRSGLIDTEDSLSIFIVTKGACKILWKSDKQHELTATYGQIFAVPAILSSYELVTQELTEIFQVSIPA